MFPIRAEIQKESPGGCVRIILARTLGEIRGAVPVGTQRLESLVDPARSTGESSATDILVKLSE